jgi:phosphinothricin acetyltransferase
MNDQCNHREEISGEMVDILIDRMDTKDWSAVQAIHREGIATGNASFERDVPEWEQWDRSHLPVCRLVARSDREVVGWAALSPASSRCFYSGVVEESIYVKASERNRGIGKALLRALVDESERQGFWTLLARIFPENQASVGVHLSLGFHVVGVHQRLGQMNGVWRDVLLMERRSPVVGV